ncbi:hypothetical protein GIB67_013392, partial [Kingdonia uniflora]
VNISLGPSEDRQLLTGLHIVNDVYCSSCQQMLGWRYVREGIRREPEVQRRQVHSRERENF